MTWFLLATDSARVWGCKGHDETQPGGLAVTRNVAASVHQRLLNHARAEERPFNQVLQHFALERFLYRLGRSPYCEQFVLKGALMLTAWQVPIPRPTRDIDLLGRLDNSVEQVVAAIRDICREPAPEDGLRYAPETVIGERIIETADHAGVRVRFAAYLGTARISMQIDVGFGDPIVPGASPVRLRPTGRPQPQPGSHESPRGLGICDYTNFTKAGLGLGGSVNFRSPARTQPHP
jgi:hypothetical protein